MIKDIHRNPPKNELLEAKSGRYGLFAIAGKG
jgi:hypothetical protein